ncbi:hypothetical protein KXV35_005715 [Aspergillus fumigatus]|nr:hypothetical protein KXV35_005715 [Aspergillus fumigatus]
MRILTSFFPILMLGPRAHASDVPELPSRDPFYTPKASNWTDEKVGTILDSRRVTIDLPILPGGEMQKDANKAAAGWSLNQMIFVAEALSDAGSPVLNRVGRREDTPHGLGGPSAATVSVLDI